MRTERREDGLGLIEVLIALGIGSLIVIGINRMMTSTFTLQRKAEVDDQRLHLFNVLRKSVSCEKTYENLGENIGNCGSKKNQMIAVFRSDKELISNTGTQTGKWSIQAKCIEGEGIDVRLSYTGSTGSKPFLDPLTKMPLDFEHPKNRLSPLLCSEQVGSENTETDLDCVTASRRLNSITASKPNIVSPYNSGEIGTETLKWGIVCGERYNRMSCAISTPTKTPADYDMTLIPRGCASDNDEWDGQFTIQMVCCKLTKQ